MSARQYFYTDETGNTQKYVYCGMCLTGPFKQEERDTKYTTAGNERPMAYCVRCARTIGFSALPIPASEIYSTIKEKPVIFEKSTHVVSEIKQDISIKKPIKIVAEKPKKPIVTKYDKIILAELSEKKRIPFGSRNLIYIAQDSVGAFLCGVTTDLGKEAKSLNNGGAPDTGGMPIEIVYYRTEKSKDSANNMKKALLKLDHKQKEQLVQVFEKQYF